ncbi:MAG TPA: hypothetical protein VJ739_02405, partial [Gemmataceae bacterium]|nr:hypothetical protein [Gemmataceae bacterium]
MTDPADVSELSAPPPPQKKGRPLLAWVVILAAVGFLVFRAARPHLSAVTTGEGAAEPRNEVMLEVLGRTTVGAGDLFPALRHQLFGEIQELNTGPLDQRLRFVVLVGELRGPDEARQQLATLQEQVKDGKVRGSPEDRALLGILQHLYGDYAAKKYAGPSV